MYVISVQCEGKARSANHQLCNGFVFFCLFFSMSFVNVERPRAFSAQLASFTCQGSKVSHRQLTSNSVLRLSPSTGRVPHWDVQSALGRPPLCSLSVFASTVWFVSGLSGWVEHRVVGRGLEVLTQWDCSWRGMVQTPCHNPGMCLVLFFKASRLPDYIRFFNSSTCFCFLTKDVLWWFLLSGSLIFHPNVIKGAGVRWFVKTCWWQQIPQTKTGGVLLLEICVGPISSRCRWFAQPSSCVHQSTLSTEHN